MKQFSQGTRIYVFSTILVGSLLYAWWLSQLNAGQQGLLVLAAAVASLLQVLSVFGATARSSYSLSWIVYGFSLVALGPAATLVVILVAHVAEWIADQERLTWYVQLFNVGSFAIATSVAASLLILGEESGVVPGSTTWLFMVLFALAAFTVANHMQVGWVIKLARRQTLSESGVMGTFTLMLDFALLCLGLLATIVWEVNPLGLVVVALMAYLLYEALKIPALERKAETDAKTDLYHAGYFNRALEEELGRALRFKRPLSVIMADLDLLRNINNSYGHLAGDVVLQGVARTLQRAAGEYEVVCRFGGEEFALLMPESTEEVAYARAESVRKAIAASKFTVETSVEPIQATMSFGVATFAGGEITPASLIDRADKALYQAKRSGRNRVCVFGRNGSERVAREAGATAPAEGERREAGPAPIGPEVEGTVEQEAVRVAADRVEAKDGTGTARAGHYSPPPSRNFPRWSADLLIGGLIALDLAIGYFVIRNSLAALDGWTELVPFAVLALLVEYMAVEIYLRDTTVSTSAALLVSGVLLFGPTGALFVGPVIALASYLGQQQRLRALIFNAGNHVFAGLLVAGVLQFAGAPAAGWTLPSLLLAGAAAGGIVFVSTTYLLAAVVTLSRGGSFLRVWRERFRWLAVYYVVLGVVAGGLVFSYRAAGLPGLLVVAAPLFMLRYSQKQYLDHTAQMVNQLRGANAELVRQADEIAELNEDLLLTLARSVDLRDPYVMEHSKHVARYAAAVAEALGLSPERVEKVRKAGLLHDIGKLGIPDNILFKPNRLSDEEYETMKQHVEIGTELIHGCHSLHGLMPIVRHHHEWYDGSGYPDGLAGEEIILEARILCLADAVEAMASDRPYQMAMAPGGIAAEVARCAGNQFDPDVVDAFVGVVARQGEAFIVNSARSARDREVTGEWVYLSHPPHV